MAKRGLLGHYWQAWVWCLSTKFQVRIFGVKADNKILYVGYNYYTPTPSYIYNNNNYIHLRKRKGWQQNNTTDVESEATKRVH